MPYATQSDLLQRMSMSDLIQLTDDARTNVPDAIVIDGVLEEASGRVDAYCRKRYVTPLQASDTATSIARDIAVYELFSRRPGAMSEIVRQRYEDAVALLKDISSGKASLDQPLNATPQAGTGVAVRPSQNRERFRDHDIEGFI